MDRHVKIQRRLVPEHILTGIGKSLLQPPEIVDHHPLPHQHAFRDAGRPAGEQHIQGVLLRDLVQHRIQLIS